MRTRGGLYEANFRAWTQSQARELRRLERMRPDTAPVLAHLAEEIGHLGQREREAAFGLAQVIIEHLLLIVHAQASEPGRH